jgi:hypothetical protein
MDRWKHAPMIIAASMVALASGSAIAQAPEWRITPYAWIAGIDGTVGASGSAAGGGGRIDVDGSTEWDLGGFMLHAAWRSGRVVAFGDWTYANVKTDAPTPFATLYSGVDVKVKGNVVEGYVGYELTGSKTSHVDVFAGARYYDLKTSLGLREGVLPGTLASSDRDWVDGVVGVRFDMMFAPNWEAFASADVGAGGSELSWQLYGGIGYRFGWGSVLGGWRHLHIDYDKGDFRLDAALTGPFIGASFQF